MLWGFQQRTQDLGTLLLGQDLPSPTAQSSSLSRIVVRSGSRMNGRGIYQFGLTGPFSPRGLVSGRLRCGGLRP